MEYLYYGEQAQQQVEKEERRPTLLFTDAVEKMYYYDHCISSILMESYDEKFKNKMASYAELPSAEKIEKIKATMKFLCVTEQVRKHKKNEQRLQLGLAMKLHRRLENKLKGSQKKRLINQKQMKAYYLKEQERKVTEMLTNYIYITLAFASFAIISHLFLELYVNQNE